MRIPALAAGLLWASSALASEPPPYLAHMERFDFGAKAVALTAMCGKLGYRTGSQKDAGEVGEVLVAEAIQSGIPGDAASRLALQAMKDALADQKALMDTWVKRGTTNEELRSSLREMVSHYRGECDRFADDALTRKVVWHGSEATERAAQDAWLTELLDAVDDAEAQVAREATRQPQP